MNISKEQVDEVNIVVSMQIGKEDYEPKVNEILRDYRRKTNIQGFRPGKVPDGIIRKKYGKAVMIDEINKLVSESLPKYIEEQNLRTLGNPLPKSNGDEIEWEIGNDFTFDFEIGLAPEVSINLSKEDRINKYQIIVDQDMIDEEIKRFSIHFRKYMDVDFVEDFMEKLIGDIVQIGEDGQPLQNGLSAEDSSLLVEVIKDDECKKLFENAKTGDEIVFNLWQAFPNEREIASILKMKDKNEVGDISESLFRYTVKIIQKPFNAELDQELFDKVLGKDVVSNLEEFKTRIRENFISEYEEICFSKFNTDIREYLLNKFNPQLPEEFLLKWMKSANKDLDEEIFEKEFPQFLENMKWEMIANAIIRKYELKVNEQEIVETAKTTSRAQLNMYGMKFVPDDILTQQAMKKLKDENEIKSMASHALERKIVKTINEIVDLNVQEISMDDFNNMVYAASYKKQVEEVGETGKFKTSEEVETVESVEDNETVEEAAPVEIVFSDETPEAVEEVIEIVEEENQEQEKVKEIEKNKE